MTAQLDMMRTFPASIDHLYEMLHFVRERAQALGFEDSIVGKIELAVEEALVNIISYAYPNGSGNVEIQCLPLENSGIKIVLLDSGVSYDPLKNAPPFNPKAALEERDVGGYGIFFILQMMDKVTYHRDRGFNILTLIKNKH